MIDHEVRAIAQIQGDLFKFACDTKDCSSSFFVKQYMFSDVAARLTDIRFLFTSDSPASLYSELKEKKKLNVGKEIYPKETMYWMGYLISVMAFSKNLSPKEIYRIVKPKELLLAYEAYHSLDIEDAVERIIESKSLPKKNDLNLLRKIKGY